MNLHDGIILIYGKKKIGKTSLVNEFTKKCFNLMVEPMARNLKIHQRACETYEDLIEYTKLLKKKNDFTSVSLDPLPLFYDKSMQYTCRVKGFDHPGGQNDFGQSWSYVKKDFNKAVLPLLQLDMGVFFHAHEFEEEVETRNGDKFKVMRPEGGSQVKEFIDANIENIWYYHYRGKKRFLQIRGDDYVNACTAWTDKFYTPNGRQIFAIPLGTSVKEGYENIKKSFQNKQTETYESIKEEVKKEKKKKKRLRRVR